ncbi:MAG: tetratricopeptide repeat protein [Pseudoxanthomonas sp.]
MLIALLAMAGACSATTAVAPPAPAQVMAIPPELRDALRHAVIEPGGSRAIRLKLLMQFLFDTQAGLGMTYDYAATLTVEEAWRTRKANCLTFTILSLVLAREVGLEAHAQHIDEALSWRQENLHLVRSDHVNTGVRLAPRRYTIDVASNDILTRDPPRVISDAQLLAIYYSNRAMELAIAGDYPGAAPYMTASLDMDPASPGGLNNAGVVAMRSGDLSAAERYYGEALKQAPEHWGALINLSQLYERLGDVDRARALRARSERVLARDPFHQFMAGHQAEAAGDYATAVERYRRATRLHANEHRFHFALARALVLQGETRKAIRALTQARKLADTREGARYEAKLNQLRTHVPR